MWAVALTLCIALLTNQVRAAEGSNLNSIALSTSGNTSAAVQCVLSPYTPIYHLSAFGASSYFEILFRGTSEKNAISLPPGKGLVEDMILTPSGSDLMLKITLSAKATIHVRRDQQGLHFEFIKNP
jgi:hypothetical protein